MTIVISNQFRSMRHDLFMYYNKIQSNLIKKFILSKIDLVLTLLMIGD